MLSWSNKPGLGKLGLRDLGHHDDSAWDGAGLG